MKILFLMFAFPDMNKSFNMYTALVDQFHKNGHKVTVLAPDPVISSSAISVEGGVEVLRVKTLPIKNVSNIAKGISNVILPMQYWSALKKFYKNRSFDVVITPTPPITLGGIAFKIKKKYNAKFYLILRDIFPQNAIDLKFMKEGGLLHKYFARKELNLYRWADAIGCMSQANIEYMKKHHEIPNHKLHILRNWQYKYSRTGAKGTLKAKYDLEGKFVIVFGGNMGKPQQLENVLALAESVLPLQDILFLFLGEGVQIQKIEAEANAKGLTNIKIKRTIPKQEYQDLLSVCDVGLISLHKYFTIPNIPSKALDYFNVGIPVLASLDSATDFNQILDDTQSGLWSIAGDHEALFANLMKLYQNTELRKIMGENGVAYFNQYLLPEQAYEAVMFQLRQ